MHVEKVVTSRRADAYFVDKVRIQEETEEEEEVVVEEEGSKEGKIFESTR